MTGVMSSPKSTAPIMASEGKPIAPEEALAVGIGEVSETVPLSIELVVVSSMGAARERADKAAKRTEAENFIVVFYTIKEWVELFEEFNRIEKFKPFKYNFETELLE